MRREVFSTMGACFSALQAKQTPAVTGAAARKRMITMAEVEQHSSDTSAWIVVKDKVILAPSVLIYGSKYALTKKERLR